MKPSANSLQKLLMQQGVVFSRGHRLRQSTSSATDLAGKDGRARDRVSRLVKWPLNEFYFMPDFC
jgi:hypothetical protein